MNKKIKLLVSGVLTLSISFGSMAFGSVTPGSLLQSKVYAASTETQLPKYMILMDDQFEGNAMLAQFIDWKKRKGNDVVVVKTSQIPSAVYGAPTNEELVSYMRGLSDADYPKYLLILGDETADNGVAGQYAGQNAYSDVAIRSRDNNNTPELYGGRLPASNNAELSIMLTKVINMDRTPPSSDMYNKILVAGQIQDSRDEEKGMEDLLLFGETQDGIASYFESSHSGISYNCTRAVVNPDKVTADTRWFDWRIVKDSLFINEKYRSVLWDGATGELAKIGTRVYNTFVSEYEAKSRIANAINQGTAIIAYEGHGEHDGWSAPELRGYEIKNFQNGINLPLVISSACYTGAYSYTVNGQNKSFLKPWLTNPNGGAYAVIASPYVMMNPASTWFHHALYMSFLPDYRSWHNTTTYPAFTSDMPYAAVEGIEEGSATRLGEMVYYAQMYTKSVVGGGIDLFGMEVFGDPEAHIRFKTPVTQNVTHLSRIFSGTSSSVTINAGAQGAEVCLYSEELGIHKKAITGSDGLTTFNLNVLEKGIINVTVTRADARPYEGTISVRKYGDIDNNGVVNSFDMAYLLQYLKGMIVLTGDEAIAADLDADGDVNSIDLAWMRKYNLGEINLFPAEN